MVQFVYDGSLEGIFTAVFEYFERKITTAILIEEKNYQAQLFHNDILVTTDSNKAQRVFSALQRKLDKIWIRKCTCTYLSECPEGRNSLFHYFISVFKKQGHNNYALPEVLAISQYAKSVEREKHRMEAFIRFELSEDQIYYAAINPDFNVIPLIIPHFQSRYADQQWLIYDLKRHYGVYYNLVSVTEISLAFMQELNPITTNHHIEKDESESKYNTLWQSYFKSTNIEARKNLKLQLKHIPKRYWRFLNEKQDYFVNK